LKLYYVGGVPLQLYIDSGSPTNFIDQHTWQDLRNKGMFATNINFAPSSPFYSYTDNSNLELYCTATTTFAFENCEVEANLAVVRRRGEALLGKVTAKQLGVLRTGPLTVNRISNENTPLGKLKNYQLEIVIDESVVPKIQPLRRVPFALRERVEKKLSELLNRDII
jgi:hypothetical protein